MQEQIKMPFVITICSGKGGVGKSVLTSNIAFALSRLPLNVLIWDANNRFPNQHLLLGVEPPSRLIDVYSNKIPVVNAIYHVKENLYLLADMPASGDNYKPDASQILDVYLDLLNETNFDIILIDTPAADSDEVLQCCNIADLVTIIVTDEPTSLIDAYALIKILLQFLNNEKISLLVNDVIDSQDADDISTILNLATEKFLNLKFDVLGYIPYDRSVRQSILQQELFILNNIETEISKAIFALANNIASKLSLVEKT
jgi:flagellar biosynthesis protein FlhG